MRTSLEPRVVATRRSTGLKLFGKEFPKLGVPKGSVKGLLEGYYKGCFKGLYKGLEFPKISCTVFWGPYNQDPTI